MECVDRQERFGEVSDELKEQFNDARFSRQQWQQNLLLARGLIREHPEKRSPSFLQNRANYSLTVPVVERELYEAHTVPSKPFDPSWFLSQSDLIGIVGFESLINDRNANEAGNSGQAGILSRIGQSIKNFMKSPEDKKEKCECAKTTFGDFGKETTSGFF